MFLITHNGEAIAVTGSMAQAKELQRTFRHSQGVTSIVHVDNQIVANQLDEESLLAAERDWRNETYLQPHHD